MKILNRLAFLMLPCVATANTAASDERVKFSEESLRHAITFRYDDERLVPAITEQFLASNDASSVDVLRRVYFKEGLVYHLEARRHEDKFFNTLLSHKKDKSTRALVGFYLAGDYKEHISNQTFPPVFKRMAFIAKQFLQEETLISYLRGIYAHGDTSEGLRGELMRKVALDTLIHICSAESISELDKIANAQFYARTIYKLGVCGNDRVVDYILHILENPSAVACFDEGEHRLVRDNESRSRNSCNIFRIRCIGALAGDLSRDALARVTRTTTTTDRGVHHWSTEKLVYAKNELARLLPGLAEMGIDHHVYRTLAELDRIVIERKKSADKPPGGRRD